MAVPSRKNRMVQRMIKNSQTENNPNFEEKKEKRVTEEEHQRRMEKLKKMGLIK